MATTSRTYLSTDWKIWTYKPVSGAFRLDFSLLDGSDVLGSTNGTIDVLDLDINSISITDGSLPSQSIFGQLEPATANISASYSGWSESVIKELYPGKFLAITLKNESATDIDLFGKNSVYFIGNISFSNFEIDPINNITTFNIEAQDIFSAALNQSIEVQRSTASTKAAQILLAINSKPELFDSRIVFGSDIDMTAQFESSSLESRSLGQWLDDLIATYVSIPECQYALNGTTLERRVTFQALHAKPTSGIQITDNDVLAITMATDGADIPTSFNLSNSTTSYNNAISGNSILTLPVNYSSFIDVNGVSQLEQIATKITSYAPQLSPVQITVNTATPYQSITFDNSQPQSGGIYYYPERSYANGTNLDIYLDYFATGGVTPHYYTKIVGQNHQITPDYWQTTYYLMKGK